jgi:replicative DNA helicase
LLYENYTRFRSYIDKKSLSKEAVKVLTVIDDYFHENETDLSVDNLVNLFFSKHIEHESFYVLLFDSFQNKPHLDSAKGLLESYRARRIGEELSVAAYDYSQGKSDLHSVLSLTNQLENPEELVETEDFVSDDIEKVLYEQYEKPGLKFRLKTLCKALGSLRKGDFGFIFARPESGKTTFLASELTFMAEQLKDEDGPILWFNNEEQGGKVQLRLIQASLGCTVEELRFATSAKKAEYLKRTKGKLRIVKDDAQIERLYVEAMCKKYNPSLVVFDQIDKLYGFSSDREDERLGAIYIWARELAKKHCPVIGVCQASASGEGKEFLTMGDTANSKTSKAAEADWILGIGARHDFGYEYSRGFAALKNKLNGDPEIEQAYRHGKWQVTIQPQIGRYCDND